MATEVIVAIVGLIGTVITTIGAVIAAAIVPILEKRLEKKGKKGKKQSANKRSGKKSRFSLYYCIPAAFALLTLIVYLGVQHEARQNVKKILYNSPEFHINQGDQYAALGDFASAEAEYYQAIEDDQSDAFAHDKRAVALAKDGRLEEALKENIAACALAPDVAQYHNNKGVTLCEMGRYEGFEKGNEKTRKQHFKNAAKACEKAIELDSNVADYHYNFSRALFATIDTVSDIDDAVSECETALRLNSNRSEYHSFYAILLITQGQSDNALTEAQKAVELSSYNADAYFKLGFILEELNQPAEAASAYQDAIRLNPDNGVYHNYLARALYKLGHYREALTENKTDIAISLTTAPPYQQSIAYFDAAQTLFMLNLYSESLQYVEKAIELYPDNADYHYVRYALLTYFNRHEEAAQELQTAYELGGIPLPEDAKT